MARKSNSKAYSHTALLRDPVKDENGKTVSLSAPYGSADLANDGSILAIRHWDKDKPKSKAPKKKAA